MTDTEPPSEDAEPVDAGAPVQDGPGLFGDTDPETSAYQVLARKYRPRSFDDMIGQEAMVRTLANAFKSGRIAHAFMFTGVRGVGKTTTARLLARALNFVSEDGAEGPQVTLDPPGRHCQAIMESRHPDVLELDAASRSGVADMRDLLDGVRYGPISARFKVYIIDEVHMLSTAAFNALLKTLEEPPPHAKFIFATTEIRKVPITVLSRCQRFDLRRIEADRLTEHLKAICEKEGAILEDEAFSLIARAAEGSARDALSILDQAIVQNEGDGPVSVSSVRDMLGLADRGLLLDLFEVALRGDADAAMAQIDGLYRDGAEPLIVLGDLMNAAAEAARAHALGEAYRHAGPNDVAARYRSIAQAHTAGGLDRAWKILLQGHQDAQVAPDAFEALTMTVLRLAAAAHLPSPEAAAALIRQASAGPSDRPSLGGEQGARTKGAQGAQPTDVQAVPVSTEPIGGGPQASVSDVRSLPTTVQAAHAVQPSAAPIPDATPEAPKPHSHADQDAQVGGSEDVYSGPKTFDEVRDLLEERRRGQLLNTFESCLRPKLCAPGRLQVGATEALSARFLDDLRDFLEAETGYAWTISVGDGGGETIRERVSRLKQETLDAAAQDPNVKTALAAFPDADLISVCPPNPVSLPEDQPPPTPIDPDDEDPQP